MMISERSRTLKHDTTMTLTTALFKVRYDHNLITGRAKTLFDMTMFFSQDAMLELKNSTTNVTGKFQDADV